MTLTADETTRRVFLDNILAATETGNLTVVLTLRGDFFGRAITSYRPLSDRVQGAEINLGPMNKEELRRAVVEPAKKVGLEFEPGLVELILGQTGEEPGNLPLLEFVLRLLWKSAGEGTAPRSLRGHGPAGGHRQPGRRDLRQAGGDGAAGGASDIPAPGAAGGRAGRHPAAGQPQGVRRTLPGADLPAGQRTPAGDLPGGGGRARDGGGGPRSLIQHWQRLQGWVNEDRRFLTWQQHLSADATEWLERGRLPELLLRGLPLTEARQWLQQRRESLSPQERTFIEKSRRRTSIRRGLAGAVTALVFLVALGLWSTPKGKAPGPRRTSQE